MDVNAWTLIATVFGVLLYIALPVALAAVYLSRVNAALRGRGRGTGADGGGPDAR